MFIELYRQYNFTTFQAGREVLFHLDHPALVFHLDHLSRSQNRPIKNPKSSSPEPPGCQVHLNYPALKFHLNNPALRFHLNYPAMTKHPNSKVKVRIWISPSQVHPRYPALD